MQRRGTAPPINLAWETAEHRPHYRRTTSRGTGSKISADKNLRKMLSYRMECRFETAGGHDVTKNVSAVQIFGEENH